MKSSNSVFLRWGSWFLTALVFGTACWFLSQWQFSRAAEVDAYNNLVQKNYDTAPVDLANLFSVDQVWDKKLEFRQVIVSGHYLPETALLIRNRPLNGNPGFLQLVCFETDVKKNIWVERGWLPTGNAQDNPDDIPAIDSSQRTLVLHLRSSEEISDKSAPAGQLANLNIPLASKDLDQANTYTSIYGRLASEVPALEQGTSLGKPELNPGNHFSYALQWIVFGLMAFGAVAWNISQDRRRRAGLPARKLRILNQDKDAEIEDQLVP